MNWRLMRFVMLGGEMKREDAIGRLMSSVCGEEACDWCNCVGRVGGYERR